MFFLLLFFIFYKLVLQTRGLCCWGPISKLDHEVWGLVRWLVRLWSLEYEFGFFEWKYFLDSLFNISTIRKNENRKESHENVQNSYDYLTISWLFLPNVICQSEEFSTLRYFQLKNLPANSICKTTTITLITTLFTKKM